jgi:hypothetical protein
LALAVDHNTVWKFNSKTAAANDRTTTREHPPADNTPAPSSLTAADPQEDATTIVLTLQ